jgi:enterochelin esterase-like enzyme
MNADWRAVYHCSSKFTSSSCKAMIYLVMLVVAASRVQANDEQPSAAALIERFAREKSPVWADGQTATFFFRGDALKVEVIAGGDFKALERLGASDVWSVTFKLPEVERAVISYQLTATRKGSPKPVVSRQEGVWRGPKAPPRALEASELRGSLKTVEIESHALSARRKLTVYLPPEMGPGKAIPVIYAADGEGIGGYARVLEPVVTAGKLPPIVVVGVHSGGYLGGAPDFNNYDTRKDLRAQEYFPGINQDRFDKHETFYCNEVTGWAERALNVSRDPKDRIVFGTSNGARFVFEVALRHPDRFSSVLAFSVPGGGPIKLPEGFKTQTRFCLEAGTWERQFYEYTTRLGETLKRTGVPVELRLRVGGHDEAIWREEFVYGLMAVFGAR